MFRHEKHLASKINRGPENVPPLVLAILRQASEKILDPKHTGIEAHETEAWLTAFARGVQYTHETYGHIMSGFGIFNSVTNDQEHENQCLVIYDATNDFVAITRGFIERQIKTTRGLPTTLVSRFMIN